MFPFPGKSAHSFSSFLIRWRHCKSNMINIAATSVIKIVQCTRTRQYTSLFMQWCDASTFTTAQIQWNNKKIKCRTGSSEIKQKSIKHRNEKCNTTTKFIMFYEANANMCSCSNERCKIRAKSVPITLSFWNLWNSKAGRHTLNVCEYLLK